MPPVRIDSDVELFRISRSFPSVHLFLGYGSKAQYRNVEEVMHAIDHHLTELQAKCTGQVGDNMLSYGLMVSLMGVAEPSWPMHDAFDNKLA